MKNPKYVKIINKGWVNCWMYHIHSNRVCIYSIQIAINKQLFPAAIDLMAHENKWFPPCPSNMKLGFLSVDPG